MSVNYAKMINNEKKEAIALATEALPGQVANNGGGFSFEISMYDRFLRFLILGSEGGSFYQGELELTRENATNIIECIKADGEKSFAILYDVFANKRAPKDNTVLFVLALMCVTPNNARAKAMASIPEFCRTGTNLFMLCDYLKTLSGWGRALKRNIGMFYTSKNEEQLVYQILKFRSREGWTHKDVLRLTHVRPSGFQKDVFEFICANDEKLAKAKFKNKMINDYLALASSKDEKAALRFIKDHNASWEMLPTELLNNAAIWKELVKKTKLTALIRNLNRFSNLGLLESGSSVEQLIVEKLTNQEELRYNKIHPLNMLNYWRTYSSGCGFKGSGTWAVNSRVAAAMEEAFYLSFKNIEKTNKKWMLAIDCSGSMTWPENNIRGTKTTSRDAAAAMAMVAIRTESLANVHVKGFSSNLVELPLKASMSLEQVSREMDKISAGSTNCAAPIEFALKNKLMIDVFVIYTDNEVNSGKSPVAVLKEYRKKVNPQAKMIVVGMSSTGFSIADPKDRGMLDVVGFDSSAPAIMNEFVLGNI